MRLFRPACRLQVHLSEGRPINLELEAKEINRGGPSGKSFMVGWTVALLRRMVGRDSNAGGFGR